MILNFHCLKKKMGWTDWLKDNIIGGKTEYYNQVVVKDPDTGVVHLGQDPNKPVVAPKDFSTGEILFGKGGLILDLPKIEDYFGQYTLLVEVVIGVIVVAFLLLLFALIYKWNGSV